MNLKFWEKKNDFDFGNDPLSSPSPPGDDLALDKNDLGLPPMPEFNDTPAPSFDSSPPAVSSPPSTFDNPSFASADPKPTPSFSPQPSFDQSPPQQFSAPPSGEGPELQTKLILAHLDGIKNQLELLNQRMTNLEHQQQPQQKGTQRGPWYRQ